MPIYECRIYLIAKKLSIRKMYSCSLHPVISLSRSRVPQSNAALGAEKGGAEMFRRFWVDRQAPTL